MAYAEHTPVPVDKTRLEIERTLVRYGAKRFAYFTEQGRAIIVFEAHERRLRFDLPVPEGEDRKAQQLQRSRWRALLLCIKAKLESVESEIETFETAFLAHIVMPDGLTVGQHTLPTIKQTYLTGEMPPLLPSPGKPK